MLSIALSAIAFFVSSYYLRRCLVDMGIPKGMTRGVLIFSIALAASYVVAPAADHLPQANVMPELKPPLASLPALP